ncbi:hypothetical protein [Pseudoduganella violaceinigra]|uniref:hypothetical protein n=1 Tax=Pseudoduganella violaceinigra TaxID=246602 RepID=UPI0004292C8B|nr:hypothetical protein [Pseudoduganella violaceinigra]
MFPKPPRPEPPRKAIAMQVVQQRVTGALDTSVIVLPAPDKPPAAETPADQGRGIQPI